MAVIHYGRARRNTRVPRLCWPMKTRAEDLITSLIGENPRKTRYAWGQVVHVCMSVRSNKFYRRNNRVSVDGYEHVILKLTGLEIASLYVINILRELCIIVIISRIYDGDLKCFQALGKVGCSKRWKINIRSGKSLSGQHFFFLFWE